MLRLCVTLMVSALWMVYHCLILWSLFRETSYWLVLVSMTCVPWTGLVFYAHRHFSREITRQSLLQCVYIFIMVMLVVSMTAVKFLFGDIPARHEIGWVVYLLIYVLEAFLAPLLLGWLLSGKEYDEKVDAWLFVMLVAPFSSMPLIGMWVFRFLR